MAVVVVSANNTRVDDGESGTGYLNIGGGSGGASEGSFPYQGNNLFNRKVTSSSGAGFYYDPTQDGGSAIDMTNPANRTMMLKFIVTDYGGLQPTNGTRLRLGSGTGAYYDFVTAGSLSPIAASQKYPDKGGIVILPVDPNVIGYRNSTSGSPLLTAVDYFGFVFAFSNSTAKSENCGADAIDIGTGLTIVGGDGATQDASFQDFLNFDEGTVNNRFGYVTASNTILNCFGTLTIGGAIATGFTDNNSKLLFLDGMFDSGWSAIDVDLQNASSVINIGCQIDSLGTDTVVDTRTDLNVSGTSGIFSLSATLINFRNIILTSAVTVSGANIECKDLTQANADISDSIIKTNAASTVACIDDADFLNLSGVTFIQIGSGHAIEITTAGTYNLDNLKFSSYGGTTGTNLVSNSGANDAAIYNNSGGLVTLNISGGDTPSVRNGASSTTEVSSPVSFKFTVNPSISSYEWRIYSVNSSGSLDGSIELDGEESATLDNQTYLYNYTSDIIIAVQIIPFPSNDFEEKIEYFTLRSINQDVNISLNKDNNN